jgi:hypothetical protein
MQRALERGEVPEEELKALESDVTGKVSYMFTCLILFQYVGMLINS